LTDVFRRRSDRSPRIAGPRAPARPESAPRPALDPGQPGWPRPGCPCPRRPHGPLRGFEHIGRGCPARSVHLAM